MQPKLSSSSASLKKYDFTCIIFLNLLNQSLCFQGSPCIIHRDDNSNNLELHLLQVTFCTFLSLSFTNMTWAFSLSLNCNLFITSFKHCIFKYHPGHFQVIISWFPNSNTTPNVHAHWPLISTTFHCLPPNHVFTSLLPHLEFHDQAFIILWGSY